MTKAWCFQFTPMNDSCGLTEIDELCIRWTEHYVESIHCSIIWTRTLDSCVWLMLDRNGMAPIQLIKGLQWRSRRKMILTAIEYIIRQDLFAFTSLLSPDVPNAVLQLRGQSERVLTAVEYIIRQDLFAFTSLLSPDIPDAVLQLRGQSERVLSAVE